MWRRCKARTSARGTIGRFLAFGAVLCTAVGMSGAAEAAKKAAMIVDANSGRVLYAQSADELRYPASLTKMMTLYIVFELMHQGRLKPGTPIRFSQEAANTPPSRLGLKEGEEIALIDAVKALITKSANDVAVAVAEHIAGSEDKFARLMTQKARALGMTKTVFRNPHGLPDSEQVTTARDMITLALRLNDDFPQYYSLFSTRRFSYDGEVYRNHNTLLGRFEGTDGIKTGYTSASGFNLVSSVRRDGKHVIGAVFGGNTAGSRNATMRALLTRALPRATTSKTRQPSVAAAKPRPASQTTSWAAPRPVEASARAEDKRPAAEAEAARASAPQGPRIEIARVRPVLVAPRIRSNGARTPAPVTLASTQTDDNSASAADDVTTSGLGAPPSSLQAQAERLARGHAPIGPVAWTGSPKDETPARLRTAASYVPASPAQSASAGGFAVQVGAYGSEEEARRRLQSALDQSGGVLDGRVATTQPVQHGNRQLYRARFSGFDRAAAASACQELKRRQIDCLVARVE